MKIITLFEANDGTRFDDKIKCMEHEVLCEKIRLVMEHLVSPPDAASFANGHGYIQHDPEKVREVKRGLLKLALPTLKSFPEVYKDASETPDDVHPRSIVGRILDDCGDPVSRAWTRLMRIDDQSREWGQPYFAMNPDKGEQKRLNP